MQNHASEKQKLSAELQQLIEGWTPAIVTYLSAITESLKLPHMGDFFRTNNGTRLFFADAHTTERSENFFKTLINEEWLSSFTTAFAGFKSELTLENIDYFQTQIADYFFSPLLEHKSWQEFWSSQIVAMKKLMNDAYSEAFALMTLKQIQGVFIYTLTLAWSTHKSTQQDSVDPIIKQNKLMILPKITNSFHLSPAKIIQNHEKTQRDSFYTTLTGHLHIYINRKKREAAAYLTEQLEKSIKFCKSNTLYTCLENWEQILIEGLKQFFEAMKKEIMKKKNPEKSSRVKKAADIILDVMMNNQLRSDDLLNLIKPYLSSKKNKALTQSPLSELPEEEEEGNISSSSSRSSAPNSPPIPRNSSPSTASSSTSNTPRSLSPTPRGSSSPASTSSMPRNLPSTPRGNSSSSSTPRNPSITPSSPSSAQGIFAKKPFTLEKQLSAPDSLGGKITTTNNELQEATLTSKSTPSLLSGVTQERSSLYALNGTTHPHPNIRRLNLRSLSPGPKRRNKIQQDEGDSTQPLMPQRLFEGSEAHNHNDNDNQHTVDSPATITLQKTPREDEKTEEKRKKQNPTS